MIKYWTLDTFEVSGYKWKLEARKSKTYKTSGSDNSRENTYTYNSLGFRGDEPTKEGFKIMSLGCSHTEGVGVNDDKTWSHQLCKLIPNAVDLNFGFGGRSSDYVSRCLLTYYDLVKPDLVLIMYPNQDRKDYYTNEGGVEPFAWNPWGYFKEDPVGRETYHHLSNITNKEDGTVNWYKNHLLIKYFLQTKNTPFVWNGAHVHRAIEEPNRFDDDYRNYRDYGSDGGHPGPEHNRIYANNLYNFLKKNKILPESS
jgi:hypothetical protein